MEYFGMFKQLEDLKMDKLSKSDIYEGYFAELYEDLSKDIDNEEIDIYLKNAFITDGHVLELACGNGRITLELAKRGVKVIGIDNSSDMLRILDGKIKKSSIKVNKNITWHKQDMFNLEVKEEFNLVILPATTICLFLDDIDKIASVFNYIYERLPIGGRMIFDYIYEYINQESESNVQIITKDRHGIKEFIMWQEFKNHVPGRAIMNLYAEKIENDIAAYPEKYTVWFKIAFPKVTEYLTKPSGQ
jgi:ubiquinone/menaquinone biosynthesis C-methylase UbiE